MARGEGTGHPLVKAVWTAQMINHVHGGAVIAGWQVDELDEDWLATCVGLATELPQRRRRQQAIQAEHEKFRREYYRKYQ